MARFISKFNLFSRRALGSLGPISPGRAAITGAATFGAIKFGVPKLMTWFGREAWAASAVVTWGSVAVSILVVEGVCYVWGRDPEVHAEATVKALKELADDYLADKDREQALVKMSGMDSDQVHVMLVAMRDARPAPAEAEKERAAG